MAKITNYHWESLTNLNWQVKPGSYWIALEPIDGGFDGDMQSGVPRPLSEYAWHANGNNWYRRVTDGIITKSWKMGFRVYSKNNTPAPSIVITPIIDLLLSGPKYEKGIFLDSAVQGVKYTTNTRSGITTKDGGFRYLPGEDVQFRVGATNLGKTYAKPIVTIGDITPSHDDFIYNATANKAFFLQSLDSDNKPYNGILIPSSYRLNAGSVSVDLTDITKTRIGIGKIRKDSYTADQAASYLHYLETLQNLPHGDCEYFSPFEATYSGVLEKELGVNATCIERYRAYAYDRIVWPIVLEAWTLKSESMKKTMSLHDQIKQILKKIDTAVTPILIAYSANGLLNEKVKKEIIKKQASLNAHFALNYNNYRADELAGGLLKLVDKLISYKECKLKFSAESCVDLAVAAVLEPNNAINTALSHYYLNADLEHFNEYKVANDVIYQLYKYGYDKKSLIEKWQTKSLPSYKVEELIDEVGVSLGLIEDKWYYPGDYEKYHIVETIAYLTKMVDHFVDNWERRKIGNGIKLSPATAINGNTTINWKWKGLPGTRINPNIPSDISIKCYSAGSNYTFESPYKQTLVAGNLSGSFELVYQSAGNKKLNCVVDDIYGGLIDKNSVSIIAQEPPGDCAGKAPTDSVISAGGLEWMCANLGASRVATSPTDSEAYGDLYQWGRGTDGHEKRNSDTTDIQSTTDSPGHSSFINTSTIDWRTPENRNLWQGISGINNPCPAGFRLPTKIELNNEIAYWVSDNAAGAFGSPLKLVVAGSRSRSDGMISSAGSKGSYWSSTIEGPYSYLLYFRDRADVYYGYRAHGSSVRCLQD